MEELASNFPFAYEQNVEIMEIVKLLNERQSSITAVLGRTLFQAYLNEDGMLLRTGCSSGSDAQLFQEAPCVSASFFKSNTRHQISETLQTDPATVTPLDVLQILSESELGQQIIDFQEEKKYLTYMLQLELMKILHHHVTQEEYLERCSEKHHKISIAKGIVQAFPELADTGDCPWVSWYDYATVEFNKTTK